MHRRSYLLLMLMINATSYSMEQRAWYAPAPHDKEAEEARELDQWFDPEGLKEVCEPKVERVPEQAACEHVYLTCSVCGITFSELPTLQDHLREHIQISTTVLHMLRSNSLNGEHGSAPQERVEGGTVERETQAAREEENYLYCRHCSRSFKRGCGFARHMQCIHDQVVVIVGSKSRRFHCSYCPKSFSQRGGLVHHERIHRGEKPFKCPECGHAFAQKCNLTGHMRVHTGEKPYACPICKKSFASAWGFKVHGRVHEKRR